MQKIATATQRPLEKACGISSTLILPRSSMWKSVKKSKHGYASSATFIISDTLYENQTYEAILNLDKGPKINIVLKTACHSTVSLKPFASKRCF